MPDEGRPNPFDRLNKALRFGHCRMMQELGAQDFGDDGPAGHLLSRLVRQLDLYRAVAVARQDALIEIVAARGRGVALPGGGDHAGHLAALGELASLVRAVNVAAPQRRRLAGRSVYRCYALYTASDMARMDEDETLLLSALHAGLDDAALRDIEGRSFAILAADLLQPLLHLLLPALASSDIESLLAVLETHLDASCYASSVEPMMRPLLSGSSAAA